MAQKGVKLSQNDMDGEKSPAATAGESDDPPVANSHNRHIPSESAESPAARQSKTLFVILDPSFSSSGYSVFGLCV